MMLHSRRSRRIGTVLAVAAAAGSALALAGPWSAGATQAAGIKTITLPVTVTVQGVAVDPATGTGYVTEMSGGVAVINLATGSLTTTIPIGSRPRGVSVDPATDTAYAVSVGGRAVYVIDGATNKVTATVAEPAKQSGLLGDLTVDPATDKIYATTSSGLAIIDGATNSLTYGTLNGYFPEGEGNTVAADPATGTVYVLCVNGSQQHLLAINGSTGAIIKDAIVWGGYQTIAVDPATDTVYAAGSTVDAYNGTTLAQTGSVDLHGVGYFLADDPATGTVAGTDTGKADGTTHIELIRGHAITGSFTEPITAAPGWITVNPDTDTLLYTTNNSPAYVSVIPLTAPVISGQSAGTFTAGKAGSVTFTATGTPAPRFTLAGRLPAVVSLSGNGTLSGTPKAGTGGVYPVTITAVNGVGPAATLRFTLTVEAAAAITSANHATFRRGRHGSFTVRASGFPVATLTEKGALPRGLKFTAGSNATATISGTPASAARGRSYVITLTAKNGVGKPAVQRFTLKVS
jgi:DNA-binding beta-propeller fold protein YncE